jgi:hypothetical protein
MRQLIRFARFACLAVACTIPNLSYAGATPLGPSFVLNTPSWGGLEAQVAMSPAGDFAAVWRGKKPGLVCPCDSILMRRFRADGTPIAAEQVVSPIPVASVADPETPDIAWNPTGGFIVVWTTNDPSLGGSVYARRFGANGSPVDKLPLLVNLPQVAARSARVAVRSDGAFVVVWTGEGSLANEVGPGLPDQFRARAQARSFSPQGVPYGLPFRLAVNQDVDSFTPDVAMTPDGGFMAVWVLFDYLDSPQVYMRHFGLAGLNQDPREQWIGKGANPHMVANAHGDLVVAWAEFGVLLPQGGILARRFTSAGVPLESTAFSVGVEDGVFVLAPPAIIVEPDGGMLFAAADEYNRVFARRYDRTATPLESAGFQINDVTYPFHATHEHEFEPSWVPDLARTPSGGFLLVWDENLYTDPGTGTVRARFFKAP